MSPGIQDTRGDLRFAQDAGAVASVEIVFDTFTLFDVAGLGVRDLASGLGLRARQYLGGSESSRR